MAGSCKCSALVLLVVVVATAGALGPPNGTVGTLDFRYPDRIVEPLVDCPFEGVFPHPNDCTWYYRCYDRYGYGFFWRAYFQCEPSTQFSDELDQCVWLGDNVGCQPGVPPIPPTGCNEVLEDCRHTNVCPINELGTAFIATVEVCFSTSLQCSGQPVQALCPPGYVYDRSNQQCIEENNLCRPATERPQGSAIICENQLSGCQDYNVCRSGSQPQIYRLCKVYNNCYHRDGYNTSRNLCEGDDLFNAFTNQCVPKFEPEDACPDNALVLGDVPCVQETESCGVYESCETRETLLACDSYFVCGANSRTSVCSRGQVYVGKYATCLALPFGRAGSSTPAGGHDFPCVMTGVTPPPPIVVTPTPTDVVTPPSTDVDVTISNYVCEVTGIRPYAVGHSKLNCRDRMACDAQSPSDTVYGCKKYFECVPRGAGHGNHGNEGGHGNQGGHGGQGSHGKEGGHGDHHLRGRDRSALVLKRFNCGRNQFYSYTAGECVGEYPCTPMVVPTTVPAPTTPPPTTLETTIPETTIPATTVPDTTVEPNVVDVVVDIIVSCNKEGEIPLMPDNAKRIYCSTEALCSPEGGFQGMQNLCQFYYRCSIDTVTGQLVATPEQCGVTSMKYDFTQKTCVVPKTNLCGSRRVNQPGFGFGYPTSGHVPQSQFSLRPHASSGSISKNQFEFGNQNEPVFTSNRFYAGQQNLGQIPVGQNRFGQQNAGLGGFGHSNQL